MDPSRAYPNPILEELLRGVWVRTSRDYEPNSLGITLCREDRSKVLTIDFLVLAHFPYSIADLHSVKHINGEPKSIQLYPGDEPLAAFIHRIGGNFVLGHCH
ncbi:hypothetical protein Scep_000736 [Stephania cephalantha]|uniref:Uncharacterized protein n=1 Tax=Stephania cephalantha TaxID=152367 RepID=A0AAP0L7P4_9MAGN